MPQHVAVEREFWQFNKPDWEGLNSFLKDRDWHTVIGDDVDTSTALFTKLLLLSARRFIPVELRTVYKSTHPWINKRRKGAVEAKRHAEGSPLFREKLEIRSRVFREDFNMYVARTREKMKKLPSGSKKWWVMSKALTSRSDKNSNVPPLKTPEKERVMDAESKANLLLRTLCGKFSLIPEELNEYSNIDPPSNARQISCPYGPDTRRK